MNVQIMMLLILICYLYCSDEEACEIDKKKQKINHRMKTIKEFHLLGYETEEDEQTFYLVLCKTTLSCVFNLCFEHSKLGLMAVFKV